MQNSRSVLPLAALLFWSTLFGNGEPVSADGKVIPRRDYKGSLEEKSQEAIIIFNGSETPGEATEDLILKISVQGAAKDFSWIVPFPTEPTTAKEDPAIFKELFDFVQSRRRRPDTKNGHTGDLKKSEERVSPVEVLSRKIVGSYDVAIVKENEAGALDKWLDKEGYQPLGADAEDVVGYYRKKGYVFACMKVSDAELTADRPADLHPLRFSFKTGGRDGIYFPMKMTGLQREPFDLNLYVFYGKWINDRISKYGFAHRGLRLVHRDWDTSQCTPNAGKAYSDPANDPYLSYSAGKLPEVTRLFQKLHPGERYYLTNIQANAMRPEDVRQWNNDLWLFPYYTDPAMVPHDARSPEFGPPPEVAAASDRPSVWVWIVVIIGLGIAGVVATMILMRRIRSGAV